MIFIVSLRRVIRFTPQGHSDLCITPQGEKDLSSLRAVVYWAIIADY